MGLAWEWAERTRRSLCAATHRLVESSCQVDYRGYKADFRDSLVVITSSSYSNTRAFRFALAHAA